MLVKNFQINFGKKKEKWEIVKELIQNSMRAILVQIPNYNKKKKI